MTETIDSGVPALSVSTDAGVGEPMTDDQAEGATATPAEDEPEQDAQPQGDTPPEVTEPPKAAGGFQRRIQALTGKNRDLQAQVQALTQSLQQLSGQSATPPPVGPKEPRPEEYEDPSKYLEEKVSFEVQQRLVAAQQQQVQQQALQQVETEWQRQLTQARQHYEDFDEVVGALSISDTAALAIKQAPQGSEVAYYLGQNPDKAARLATLTPLQQLLEIGRLEVQLETTKKASKQASKAPAPIKPAGSVAPAGTDIERMSMEEFVRHRNEQEVKTRSRRIL